VSYKSQFRLLGLCHSAGYHHNNYWNVLYHVNILFFIVNVSLNV